MRHFSHLYKHFLIIIAFHSPFYFKVYASKIYTSSIFPTVCSQLQIFRTIKDDVTGAAKSVTFLGKSFQDIKTSFSSIGNIKSSFSSLKEKLNVKKIFHTPTIDIEAIKEYNRLIEDHLEPEAALAEIRNHTNQATLKLIQSTDDLIEPTQELERSSTLAGKAQSVLYQAMSTFGNMVVFSAISKGIELIVTAVDNWVHRVEKANEAMEEAVSEYASSKSRLKEINAELDEHTKKISDLQSKGPLTYAENSELEKLKEITRELLVQKDIEENRAKLSSRDAAEKTIEAFHKQYGTDDVSREKLEEETDWQRQYGSNAIGEDDIVGNLAAYQVAKEKQKQKQADYDLAKANGEDAKWEEEDLQDSINDIDAIEARLAASIADLQEKRMALEEEYQKAMEKKELGKEPLSTFEQDTIGSYEEIYNRLRLIYEEINQNGWNDMAIAGIFQTEGIEKTKEELMELARLGQLTPQSLADDANLYQAILDSGLFLNGQTEAEAFCEQIALCAQEADRLNETINAEPLSLEEKASQLQSLFHGTDLLGQIYADISDRGSFDWSSILNNEGFLETFGCFTEEYENFIQTISNAPNDIGACQEAFDSLASAYLDGSGAMDGLTEENKGLAVTMLEQMGVANAQQLVTAKLAAEEAFLAEKKQNSAVASNSLASATWQEISAVLSEGNASGAASSYLAQLAMSKLDINGTTINSQADIDAIIALANAANVSQTYLDNLKDALKNLNGANEDLENAQKSKLTGSAKIREIRMAELRKKEILKEINGLSGGLKDNAEGGALNPADFYASFQGGMPVQPASGAPTGGNAVGASPDSSLPETPDSFETAFEETFNWLESRLNSLKRKLDQWLKQAETALTGRFITKYYKKAAASMKQELNAGRQSYAAYMEKANASGLGEAYAKKVRDGSPDIESVTDKGLAEQISAYREWYEKAEEASAAFLETAEKLYRLPLDKAADKIERFQDSIALLAKQIQNAAGAKAKNTLLGKKDRKEEKTFLAQQKALKESRKNLKTAAKTLKQKGTLDGSGLSKKEKKQLKKDVKNRKEIDPSRFKKGSQAYYAALQYNEALKAKENARYQRDLAKEDFTDWKVHSAKLKFDNISDEHEKQIRITGHAVTKTDNEIALLKSAGRSVTESLYQGQKANYAKELAQYQALHDALKASLAQIPKGTDEWHDANDKLQQAASSISDCQAKIYGMNDAILKLRFDRFDELSASIGRIRTEQDFLQDLFSQEKTADSETGQFTDAGLARLASLSASYHASVYEADRLNGLLKELQQVKADGAQDGGAYRLGDWEFSSLEQLEEKIEETYAKWQNAIKDVRSLEEALFQVTEAQSKAELSAAKDLIDAKKKALDSEKDLHSYKRSIREKTGGIQDLQKQIAAVSGDTSEAGRARLQKLKEELDGKKEDLKDAEYDRYLSGQKDMLERLYEEYEETVSKRLDDFHATVKEALEKGGANMDTSLAYLKEIAKQYGYEIEFGDLFSKNIKDSVDSFLSELEKSRNQNQKEGGGEPPSQGSQPPVQERAEPNAANQVKRNGDDEIISAKNGEGILTAAQTELLLKLTDHLPELTTAVTGSDRMLLTPEFSGPSIPVSKEPYGNHIININTLSLPNVTNYEEFKTKMFRDMQNDRKFEGMIHDITIHKLSGGGRLDKHKYKL